MNLFHLRYGAIVPFHQLPFLFFFLLFNSLLSSCMDEEYASGPENRLAYSTDTLSFDTIFTTIGTSTRRLMVYNFNKKTLNISSITLKNGGNSGFKVNVDGIKGTRFENMELLKNDSLYIFVEANIQPTQQDAPKRTEDVLEFEYNGIRQQIILQAFAQDAYLWKGKIIDKDTVLTHKKPFLIYDSLKVMPGVRLELEAGTQLFLHSGAQIIVEGQLFCKGLLGVPVVMRGDRRDKLFPTLAYEEMAGQWGGIQLRASSFDNDFNYTHIRGTDFGIRIDSSNFERPKLKMENCILRNSNNELLMATQAAVVATNCEFSNAGGALLYLQGGKYRFTHCTLANLYQLGMIYDAAVHLSNYQHDNQGNEQPLPLELAQFNNCIIWGKRNTELEFKQAKDESVAFNNRFDHCLIRSAEKPEEAFIQTIWDKDPLFLKTGEQYQYDFRIDSLSAARACGNPIYAAELPFDLNGNPRDSEKADLGAYQWQEGQK